MSFLYLGCILVSALGIGLIDARWRLALFRSPKRALLAVTVGAAILLTFDLAAIATGSFVIGASEWMTGFEILPHLPIEEIAFVLFLSYISLVAVAGTARILESRRREEQ